MSSPSPSRHVAKAAVVAFAAVVPYLLTRTRDLGGDDTVFAGAVERWLAGAPEWPLLVHVHHSLYNPLVAGATALLQAFGIEPFIPDVAAALSAVFAAAAVGLVTYLLLRSGVREGVALLAGACCAASGGLWQFATRMEVYTLTALGVAAWAAAVGAREPHPARVGGAGAGALLGHLATGLLVLPTAWRLRQRPRALAVACALMLGVPGLALAGAFVLLYGSADPRSWPGLLVGPSGTPFGLHPSWVPEVLHGVVVWRWYAAVPVLEARAVAVLDALATTAVVLAAALALAGVVAVVRGRSALGITALLGALAFVPLWAVWDAGNVEHAVAAIPLLALLVGLGGELLPRRAGEAALGVLLLCLLAVNGVGSAAGQAVASNSRTWIVAEFVHRQVPPDGVILIGGADRRLRLGLGYLSGRRVVDLGVAVRDARARGLPAERALEYWAMRARRAPAAYIVGDLVSSPAATLAGEHGLSATAWSAALARFEPVGRAVLAPDGVAVREPFVLWEVRLRPTAERPASP